MIRSSALLAAAVSLLLPGILHAQEVRAIRISGAKELSAEAVRRATGATAGEALADPIERVSERVERRYRDDGYTFATVKSSFDAGSGVLAVDVDEGVIAGVEFQG